MKIVSVILSGGLNFLITGSAEFIGSIINNTDHISVTNVEKPTYPVNLENY